MKTYKQVIKEWETEYNYEPAYSDYDHSERERQITGLSDKDLDKLSTNNTSKKKTIKVLKKTDKKNK